MKRIALTLAALGALSLSVAAQSWRDASLQPADRADLLVKELTLEEKVSLMLFESPAIERLGVRPYNWWNEALHGVARAGKATVYPMPIGMAASWDAPLLEEVFTSVSDEARVKNRLSRAEGDYAIYTGLTFWTPNINIFRDPRWGRGIETYGEDPYLTSRLGLAVVRGLQGQPIGGYWKAHACAKHFAVHSGPEPSRHRFDAQVSEKDLRETYLPAFEALVKEGNVKEVMFAYNRFRGVPCGANTELLQDILRGEWGFEGVIVSDCWAVDDMFVPGRHDWAKSGVEAAAASVNAGGELECGTAYRRLVKAVEAGLVTEETIDKVVRHLLSERFALGEVIEENTPFDDIPLDVLCSAEHRSQALKMAQESMVLLKNDGILPFKGTEKIALMGPNAADSTMAWGNYNGFPERTVTLLDAMNQQISGLVYVKGCEIADPNLTISEDELAESLSGIETVVFAGGISPRFEGEELRVEVPGFKGGDRTNVDLPDVQVRLVKALKQMGKKVVFVNYSGSAMTFPSECDAILQAWYPGQEGGSAVADVLWGRYNPSGKLPVTFYASSDQLKDFEDYSMAGRTYRYFEGTPAYPFGYGLSYTDFKLTKARLTSAGVTVSVKNTGKTDGAEVIQLYVSRPGADGPVKELRGFRRVDVPAGKTVKVTIPIDDKTFLAWDESAGKLTSQRAGSIVRVGTSSADADLIIVK